MGCYVYSCGFGRRGGFKAGEAAVRECITRRPNCPTRTSAFLRLNGCAASRTAYTVQVSARESGTKTLGTRSPKQQQQGSFTPPKIANLEAAQRSTKQQLFRWCVNAHLCASRHDEQRTVLSAILVGCVVTTCMRQKLTTAQLWSSRAIRTRIPG